MTTVTTFAYIGIYFLAAGAFEYANPAPKYEKRKAEISKELKYGITAVIVDVLYATMWLYWIDKYTPFYGYFQTRSYTITWFIIDIIAYMFIFDSWFYWTHRLLHKPWWWRNVHFHHHQFLYPTAFAQDAVHPFEAVFQGPMGHHLASILVPIHPVALAFFGFCTSIYAIAAHDGRQYDFNDHCKHHTHKHVNFSLYFGFWDKICGTRYTPSKTKKWEAAYKALEDDPDFKAKQQNGFKKEY